MVLKFSKYLLLIFLFSSRTIFLLSQDDVLKYVNPFIGTTKTKTFSKWGSDGGTYPGSVAPFGYIQITPETRVYPSEGYDYTDSVIYFFSCLNHMSGYPDGSSGNLHIMPLSDSSDYLPYQSCRPFSHTKEKAGAGYYEVTFDDDATVVESTASIRSGMLRITFPSRKNPSVFVGNTGELTVLSNTAVSGQLYNALLDFNLPLAGIRKVNGGSILTFQSPKRADNVLLIKVGASQVSHASTRKNLDAEAGIWDFDSFRNNNLNRWKETLNVIQVDDSSESKKTIFYTALYHSFLLPSVISDVDGYYKGLSGRIFKAKGGSQYGSFSPWDTFRSLHPLLCLLQPERQNDIVLSLLSTYEQTGRLPKGPMTGNHVIPVIVDSWMKGIHGFDSILAFTAMKSMIDESTTGSDFLAYLKMGYVPGSFAESVTRTVEYAYDDWALAVFAGEVIKDEAEYKRLISRSLNYRNLIDPSILFLVPRMQEKFFSESAGFGYKEGDKWSYSLFVPHNPIDLVNFSGGGKVFSERLAFAMDNRKIPFDNEPVLHVPYLFNYSGASVETQKRVRELMNSHYTDLPSGIPGNDDLGSMSSWFVFSALGFYPVCPGNPYYDFGSPLFKKVAINFTDGKKLIIKTENNSSENVYVRSLNVNGSEYFKTRISHSAILRGGEIVFSMSDKPVSVLAVRPDDNFPLLTNNPAIFRVTDFSCNKKSGEPGEKCFVRFSLVNTGSFGAKVIRLFIDGKEYASKTVVSDSGIVILDSIECRFFKYGERRYTIEDLVEKTIEIRKREGMKEGSSEITNLSIRPIFKSGEYEELSWSVRNTGGFRDTLRNIFFAGDSAFCSDLIVLEPGELIKKAIKIKLNRPGIHTIGTGGESIPVKTYLKNRDSKFIDVRFPGNIAGHKVTDRSGLNNDAFIITGGRVETHVDGGLITGSVCFARFENTISSGITGSRLTVMAWIYPEGRSSGISDIITQGDYNVFQVTGGRSISFFAGGWGRGKCSVKLPEDWFNRWHHIAGVCDGSILRIYIDGKESGMVDTHEEADLFTTAKWNLGRNEEFPDSRFFNGYIDNFKLFSEPLSSTEISEEMNSDSHQNKIK